MASLPTPAPSVRPPPVTLAVVLSVIAIIGNLAGLALPTGDEEAPPLAAVILSSIVPAVAGIPAVIGLWLLRRWGFVLTVVVTVLNLLSAMIGVVAAPTVAIQILSAVAVLLTVVILVLVLRPEARRAYR